MSYALIENGAVATYPYSYSLFRAAQPDVSFPREVTDEWLAGFGNVKIPLNPDYGIVVNRRGCNG